MSRSSQNPEDDGMLSPGNHGEVTHQYDNRGSTVDVPLDEDEYDVPSVIIRAARNDPNAENLELPQSRPGVQYYGPRAPGASRELSFIGGGRDFDDVDYDTDHMDLPPAYSAVVPEESLDHSPRFGPRTPHQQYNSPQPENEAQQPPVSNPIKQTGRGKAKPYLPPYQQEVPYIPPAQPRTRSSEYTGGIQPMQPDTHFIFSVIICIVFFPLGIPALLYSLQSEKAFKEERNSRKAKESGQIAFYLNSIGAICALLTIFVTILIVFLPYAMNRRYF